MELDPLTAIRTHIMKMGRVLVKVEAQIKKQPNIASAVKEGTPVLRDILEVI